jgi:DNA-binding response OmpR family regulator
VKLLLVEDDIFFRDFYASKFKEKQFDIQVAADGEEGIAFIESFMPDLVLLDLIMPKKDGFAVLEEMKAKKLLDKIPVIVFSTLGQNKDIERAKSLGAKDYVNKSFFDFDKLLVTVLQFIKK